MNWIELHRAKRQQTIGNRYPTYNTFSRRLWLFLISHVDILPVRYSKERLYVND